MYVKIKHALSITLAVIMAVTTFACCAFSVSAEDTQTETFVPYEGYTWSPLKGVTATAGTTTTETKTTENVPLEEAERLAAITGNKANSVVTLDNGDGTVTANKVTTTHTYVANDDGATATVTTTIKKTPTVLVNPIEENSNFRFGIYSDRNNESKGVHYVSEYKAYSIFDFNDNYNPNMGSAGNTHNNTVHTLNFVSDGTPATDKVDLSYYLLKSQELSMKNTLMYRIHPYGGMWLEFVAPEDGVYSASGNISQTSSAVVEEYVKFYLIKVDENGAEHALTDATNVPDHTTATADIPAEKVALKAGEKLVLRTVNNISDGYVAKAFVEYLVTRWDYTEAEDSSTVTVNYGYQNQTFYNVYGANYALSDPKQKTLWNVKAAKYQLDVDELDTTTPTIDFNLVKNNAVFASGAPFASPATGGSQNPGVWYDPATGNVTAKLYWGEGTDKIERKNGLQFTFTMPEDGNVVLTGATAVGDNTIARVGIKKKGSNEVVYGLYYVKGGTDYKDKVTGVRGNWSQLRYAGTTNYREHTLGQLEAGDVIYYEMCMFAGKNSQKSHDLSTLSVAITSSNSEIDFNGDFKMNATDAAYLRKVIIKNVIPRDVMMFNITEDDKVDIRDLVRIKKLLAGITVE